MISNVPPYISIIFGLTVLATLLLFYRVVSRSSDETIRRRAMLITGGLVIWLILQAVLTLNGIYKSGVSAGPPKIVLFGILPTILTIVTLFSTRNGRRFIDSLPLLNITYLNTVRIPVELVLYWLFLNKIVPELMTFEGRNFDVISGITAPFVAYFGLTKGNISRQLILVWNLICLGLLLNIVVNALLSAPSPLQQFAFDQPNQALGIFPFCWLPVFVVPIVLFGHLVSIRQLRRPNQ